MSNNLKQIIDYDRNGFIINGKQEFLIGGEFHYFRVPAALWEDRLRKMKATGANLISVYIAWNLHEPEEGHQRWDGDYDLDRFLTLCEKYGFYVLIKPGPYICAELDFGGHPDWLIQKVANGEFRIRMLDEKYLELCKYWYRSCAKQINKHLITNGGTIIAAQVENEYDHLMEYGEEPISVEDAVKYFMFLKDAMEEYGINVPKFANEAEFLRGKGIIDTRTYYPNIPGLWMSEYERFEEKLLSSKVTQPDAPVMILELQAGWFSQIGEPTYVPGADVVEGVSKSVFITGASIVNYYMMVGGTTFPFIGGRGDVALGGYGNITSYDFGGAPVGETGELNREKYYWIKGFIRFAKEFNHLIAASDGKKYMKIISGGENIAVLNEDGAFLDVSIDRAYENFTTYQEGNEDGRFFFVRNVEEADKPVTIQVPEEVNGREYIFTTTIKASQTRMFPVAFKIPGTGVKLNYSISEIWQTERYGNETAVIMYGTAETEGELCLNVPAGQVTIEAGKVKKYNLGGGQSLVSYTHGETIIIKTPEATFFILDEQSIGRVEALADGILFHNGYYLEEIEENAECIRLKAQVKEYTNNRFFFYPMREGMGIREAVLDGNPLAVKKESSAMQEVDFEIARFTDRPQVEWTSAWKYRADSPEIREDYDDRDWKYLEKPVSLEEAGLFQHGYYWYRGTFELGEDVKEAHLYYKSNETDRFLLYINGTLVFRGRSKSIDRHNITAALKKGVNTIAVLYANEFHNKSHPHEGALVKYSGILHPMIIDGVYTDGGKVDVKVESFRVKAHLTGYNDGYHRLEYGDDAWQEAPDVEKLVVGREMGHVVWFRRHFRYHPAECYSAPLQIVPIRADERLLIYVNGKPVAQYDIIGPQEEFYIPDSYLNRDGDNVISMILECPGFFEEIMSGYRRGYMYHPIVRPSYVSREAEIVLKK
ncbi:MAG: beta-galactosidase [Eubacteriales bacterium]|nr:beta-galactosidase [Eubacteriales bacterium]